MTSSLRAQSPALAVANGLVRAWTRAYTWRLEPTIRDRRRAEIESELWEFQQAPERGAHPAAHVLVRLLTGIPDDLWWRAEHVSAASRRTRVRAGVRAAGWTMATLIVAAAIFILPLMTTSTLPPLPDKPRVRMPAPPPPPAPPCPPPGYPQFKPCTP